MSCIEDVRRAIRMGKLLPGVPEAFVRARFESALYDDFGGGDIFCPESASALVANAFGWFVQCPELMPSLPGLEDDWIAPQSIDFERWVRLPVSRKRFEKVDVVVETKTHLIGISSNRNANSARAVTTVSSPLFDRDMWGDHAGCYLDLYEQLYLGKVKYRYLDAAGLLRKALAGSSEASLSNKIPTLYYLFHEPHSTRGEPTNPQHSKDHRLELQDFEDRIQGSQVSFFSGGYIDWLIDNEECGLPAGRHGQHVFWYLQLSEFEQAKPIL